MTNDELERVMNFIIERQEFVATQQAQFAEQMQQANKRTDRLERIARLMVRAGLRARRNMREQDGRIGALVEAQLHTEGISQRNSEQIDILTANLQVTDGISRRNGEQIETLTANLRVTDETSRRSSEQIDALTVNLNQLAEIVRQLASARNGDGSNGTSNA